MQFGLDRGYTLAEAAMIGKIIEPGSLFEREPLGVGPQHERHIGRFFVMGLADHPGMAVRAAALVAYRILLQQQHAPSALRQVVGGRAAHHAAANDNYVVALHHLPFSHTT